MDRRRTPYIGVTGFMYRSDVNACLAAMEGVPRLLMVGILVSLRTMCGLSATNARRYPSVRSFDNLFADHPQALNLIHYHTSRPESLAGQLLVAMSIVGPNCHGVQINLAWPNLEQLKIFRREQPEARVVLQCGGQALKEAGADGLANRLEPYVTASVIDDVLLDPSGGLGQSFEPETMERLLQQCRKHGLHHRPIVSRQGEHALGFGVAGGLSASTLDIVTPLLRSNPALNIDAEGRLRDERDELDVAQAVAYLKRAAILLEATSS